MGRSRLAGGGLLRRNEKDDSARVLRVWRATTRERTDERETSLEDENTHDGSRVDRYPAEERRRIRDRVTANKCEIQFVERTDARDRATSDNER